MDRLRWNAMRTQLSLETEALVGAVVRVKKMKRRSCAKNVAVVP